MPGDRRSDWEDPDGVPIDIFVFGGRRTTVMPLVHEAFDWDHGVYMGATAASPTTAANIGAVGNLVASRPHGHDAVLRLQHGRLLSSTGLRWATSRRDKGPRKIFYVNWFRKTADGKWLWPGFGENSRVLKWMCERVEGKVKRSRHRLEMCPENRISI